MPDSAGEQTPAITSQKAKDKSRFAEGGSRHGMVPKQAAEPSRPGQTGKQQTASRIGACIRRIVAVSKAETRSRRRDLATGTAGANRVLKEGRKMSYLTQQDLQNFGPELVDLAQRAAAQVVAPEMQRLQEDNERMHAQLMRTAKHTIDQALDGALPNWREIDRHPQWLQWLQERDIYSRVKRQQLLDEAVARGDAHRVIAFFRGFLAEAAWQHGHANHQPSRQAATGKPIYTRAQITEMARRRQKGQVSDADWARWEHEMVAAGREGRILGALSLDGR